MDVKNHHSQESGLQRTAPFTELSFSDDNTVILINRHERLTAPYSHVEKNKYEVDLGYRTEVWEIEQKGKKLILDGCEYTSK